MNSHFDMLLAVSDRTVLMLICLFFLTRTRPFRQLRQKMNIRRWRKRRSSRFFRCSHCSAPGRGIHVDGSLLNVRVIAVMAGGILFGP
nr:Sensor histidine kinase YpdA [Candidatus Pantoea persica]